MSAATIRCPQCKVDVPLDALAIPNRCHKNCGLRSHGLPGSLGMNWSEEDKRRDPQGWARHQGDAA